MIHYLVQDHDASQIALVLIVFLRKHITICCWYCCICVVN